MRIALECSELVNRHKSGVHTARMGILVGLMEHLKCRDELILTYKPIGELPALPAPRYGATVRSVIGPAVHPLLQPAAWCLSLIDRSFSWLPRGRGLFEAVHRALADRFSVAPFVKHLETAIRPQVIFTSELNFFGAANAKTVAILHDLLPRRHPEWFTKANRRNFERKLEHIERDCDAVLTISEWTRQQAMELLRLPAARYFVAPMAAHGAFRPAIDGERFDDLDARFGLAGRRVILYVGTLEPRKNLGRLLDAVERLHHDPHMRDVCLVLCGGVGWHCEPILQRAERMQRDGQVVRARFVDDRSLVRLYRRADLVTYVSEDEGFGLPALEAMQSGVPVVASTGGALPEVVGDAGYTVDPYSVDAIADALATLLSEPDLRSHYRNLGLARARCFSWSATGRRVADIFRWLAGEGPKPANSVDLDRFVAQTLPIPDWAGREVA